MPEFQKAFGRDTSRPKINGDDWIELATEENALFAFGRTRRIVPTTNTRITASITAYSAIS